MSLRGPRGLHAGVEGLEVPCRVSLVLVGVVVSPVVTLLLEVQRYVEVRVTVEEET